MSSTRFARVSGAALRPFDPARRGRACAADAMPDDAPAVTRDRLRDRMNGRRMSSASPSQPSPAIEAGRQRALQRSRCRKRPAPPTEKVGEPRSWTRRAKTCGDRARLGRDGANRNLRQQTPGGPVVTDRHRSVVASISVVGAVSAQHVMARFGVGRTVGYRRLRALVDHDLLGRTRLVHGQPTLYVATRRAGGGWGRAVVWSQRCATTRRRTLRVRFPVPFHDVRRGRRPDCQPRRGVRGR
jgi:hypothetical protein